MALSLDGENRRRVADDVRFLTGSGIPTDGTSGTGAGTAGPTSFYFDITNTVVYVNDGTKASPSWTVLGVSNIANGSITTAMLADNAVTNVKMADDAVDTIELVDDSVTADKLAADSVITVKILDANVTGAKIAPGAVSTTQLGNSGVTTDKLGPNVVTAAKIALAVFQQAVGTIASADITGTGVGQFGHANGFPIVAAPGLHNVIELISLVFFYDFSVAAYGAGGNTTVNRAAGAGALTGLISAANSFGAATDKSGLLYPLTTAGLNLTENEGINLVTSAAFTQPGTAAGVIRYVCNYRIHATGL